MTRPASTTMSQSCGRKPERRVNHKFSLHSQIVCPAYLPVALRVKVLVVAPLDSHHDLERVCDRDVRLVVVRRDIDLGRAVRELQDSVEVPRPDRIQKGRRLVWARNPISHQNMLTKAQPNSPPEEEALIKNEARGWFARTFGSSDRIGRSGSFGSLFSIRSNWNRFGVS